MNILTYFAEKTTFHRVAHFNLSSNHMTGRDAQLPCLVWEPTLKRLNLQAGWSHMGRWMQEDPGITSVKGSHDGHEGNVCIKIMYRNCPSQDFDTSWKQFSPIPHHSLTKGGHRRTPRSLDPISRPWTKIKTQKQWLLNQCQEWASFITCLSDIFWSFMPSLKHLSWRWRPSGWNPVEFLPITIILARIQGLWVSSRFHGGFSASLWF